MQGEADCVGSAERRGETAAGEKCAVVSFLAFETGKKKELIAVYSQNQIFKKYDTHF